jgi:hypothetical protein
MVTVLEECTTDEQCSAVHLLWPKGLTVKDNHYSKETFPICGGKYVSCKMFHSKIKEFTRGCLKVANDAQPGAEVAEMFKRLQYCRF